MYWDATNELWGVSRYDDIEFIEKHADLFINSDQNKGGYRPNIPADPSIIGLDDPEHRTRRNLVARRFTPRAVGAWEPRSGDGQAALRRRQAKRRRAEIIGDLAAPLPAMMIGKLLGFDPDAWPDLQSWSSARSPSAAGRATSRGRHDRGDGVRAGVGRPHAEKRGARRTT